MAMAKAYKEFVATVSVLQSDVVTCSERLNTEGGAGVVLFQRTVVLLSFYVLSLLIVKVSHRGDRRRDAV